MLDQIKIHNIKQIMLCLMARRCATKAEIVEDTGLSTSTVSSCVNSLLKLKLLVVNGMDDSSGGRRSTIYRVNSAYGCFIGLDLRPEGIQGVVTDCEAQILKRISFQLDGGTAPLHAIMELLNAEIAHNKNVLGIGVGVAGKLDYEEQIIVSAPEFGWQFVHLKEIIERQYMVFTHLDHQINAGAIYEGMMGCARGEKHYLYISEAPGGKAALVLDGRLCRGADNATGDLCGTQELGPAWLGLLHFLGISQLIVGYATEEFRNKVCESTKGFGGQVHYIRHSQDTYPVSMAAVTQREWFESIYFML